MRNLISFAVGILFALGLGISGMVRPDIVRGFLDVFGEWNPALMGVMVGAIGVHIITYRFIMKRSSPILEDKFYVPTNKVIDKKLLTGAALFGLGWGWAGICPGPGVVSIIGGNLNIILFIISMLTGMFIFKKLEKFM